MLEAKGIKAPTMYETDKDAAEQFQATVNKLIEERNELTEQKALAEKRLKEIQGEIQSLNKELNRTLDKKIRDSLKKAIANLEAEEQQANETIALDIKAIMMDKVAESGVYDLQGQAKEEHEAWFKEINAYWNELDKAYQETKGKLASIRDYNLYKTTNTKLGNLERYLNQ